VKTAERSLVSRLLHSLGLHERKRSWVAYPAVAGFGLNECFAFLGCIGFGVMIVGRPADGGMTRQC